MKTVTIIALHLAYGGIERAVSELANLLAERYDVHIFSVYDMPGAPAYPLDDRISVTYLLKDIPNRLEFQQALTDRAPVPIAREGFRAAKILYEKRQSVIRAIRSVRAGVLITTRDEHNVLLSRYGREGVRKIAQLHQDHAFNDTLVRHFRSCYTGIDVFTLLSPKMKNEVAEIMRGNARTRILYVPNFLKELPPAQDAVEREKLVIAAGRLDPVKGFDRLIGVFCRLHITRPEWKLAILGGGTELEALRNRIRENGAESFITLAGPKTPEEVMKAMSKASVYALSSHSEGFPFVVLEAMGSGLPVVAFETRGGLGMLVKDGENGFLVSDEEEYLRSLLRLTGEHNLRERMALCSRELAAQFTCEAMKETWFDLIEESGADGGK